MKIPRHFYLALLLGLHLICAPALAADTSAAPAKVHAVTSAGQGQAGYVHYFLLTYPDGELEYQVGIELDDQRIAWSFPKLGVTVTDFAKSRTVNIGGQQLKVEHLHGIRPFTRDADMQVLRKELTARVVQWIDDETPYCLIRAPGGAFCMSCGDFVVRILYPGPLPLFPALPRDFSASASAARSTDDLLLYLLGLFNEPDKHAQLARLAKLDIPAVMREDALAMIHGQDGAPPASVAAIPLAKPPAPTARPPAAARLVQRRPQGRRL